MPKKRIPSLLRAGSAELIAKEFRRHKETIPILTKFIRDKNPSIRHEAIKTLGLLKREEGAEILVDLISKAEGAELGVIADALRNSGDSGIERAILGLRDVRNRQNFIIVCQRIGNEELWKTTFSANIISPGLAMKLELLIRIYHDLNYSGATVYDPALKYAGEIENIKTILTESLRDADVSARKSALSTLKRYKTLRLLVIKELIGRLDDSDEDLQVSTIKMLGEMADEVIQEGLVRKLNDPSNSVRLLTVETLGSMKSTLAIPALIKTIKTERNPEILVAAKMALGNIGEAATEPLIKELVNEEFAHHIEDTLKRIGEPAVRPLADALLHPNLKIRKQAMSLTKLILTTKYGISGTIEKLIGLLTDRSKDVQETIIESIIDFGDPAIEYSIEALKSEALRVNANHLMNQFGPLNTKVVFDRLINENRDRVITLGTILAIYSDNEDLKDLAFDTVGRAFELESSPEWIQQKVYDLVISKALTGRDKNMRFSAAQICQFFGKTPLSENHFLNLLNEKDPEIVEATLDSLAVIADTTTIADIIPKFNHKSSEVVEAARNALIEIEEKNSFLALVATLKGMSDKLVYNFINEMCAQEISKAENYIRALESERKFEKITKRLRKDLNIEI
ncbi:MAG: HEAT repeat domain-containing protein [Candidatus Hermodarchaeota archaeon]